MPNYYSSDNVIEEFYKALAGEDIARLSRVHIPRSDVFYVRAAIKANTGVEYTLDHVERAMFLEGHLPASEVFEPQRKRQWEIEDERRRLEEDDGGSPTGG